MTACVQQSNSRWSSSLAFDCVRLRVPLPRGRLSVSLRGLPVVPVWGPAGAAAPPSFGGWRTHCDCATVAEERAVGC